MRNSLGIFLDRACRAIVVLQRGSPLFQQGCGGLLLGGRFQGDNALHLCVPRLSKKYFPLFFLALSGLVTTPR